mmetsp:Transcript_40811/g.100808  ORF Transcript_40811/g.100808 Transcript_40811/m.100808 type:complete len:113 (+) Transcript_40811:55-393(+)|eukprot:CAMPEP_0197595136 /NCGR_PEP_ID=MMETSP1326-20131121/22139_1 /TAXON_ID=1155430 /ORGANISM="Genus nov. species nov., Strain RCC2288" /LENGTH=112 /DNA_ID=CAMNT_0043161439 /DNA_START=28 /DNA_END=366 /DNA_ORIENTATION=+
MPLKHNEYHAGNVHSVGFTADSHARSVGVIESTAEQPQFHFGTAAPERMTVVSGCLEVKLDGEDAWHKYYAANSASRSPADPIFFKVKGNSGFDCKSVEGPAAYLCEYLPEA